MWPETAKPANDPHAPGVLAIPPGSERDPRARLDQLMADRRIQRVLSDDGPPRELMLRMARVVRRSAAETRARS